MSGNLGKKKTLTITIILIGIVIAFAGTLPSIMQNYALGISWTVWIFIFAYFTLPLLGIYYTIKMKKTGGRVGFFILK